MTSNIYVLHWPVVDILQRKRHPENNQNNVAGWKVVTVMIQLQEVIVIHQLHHHHPLLLPHHPKVQLIFKIPPNNPRLLCARNLPTHLTIILPQFSKTISLIYLQRQPHQVCLWVYQPPFSTLLHHSLISLPLTLPTLNHTRSPHSQI